MDQNIENIFTDTGRAAFAFYLQTDYRPFESLKFITGFQANKAKKLALDIVICNPWNLLLIDQTEL